MVKSKNDCIGKSMTNRLTQNIHDEYLVNARKHAFTNFKARLREYIFQKNQGSPDVDLALLISEIKSINHQTVWHEMKRFRSYIPELEQLFDQVPEALEW